MTDDATRAWRAMRELVLERSTGQRAACHALGLSYVKVKALGQLSRQPMSLGALGAALVIDAPYTSVIVQDLERLGLVVRAPNPDDGRSKVVSVTPAGRRAARTAEAILGEPPPVVRELNPRDLATLERILSSLLSATPA